MIEREQHVLADQPRDHRVQLADGIDQVDHAPLEHLLTAEGEQLLGEPGRALRRHLDLGGVAVRRFVGRQLLDQEFAEAEDHGQQVVEVVRDAAGQAADGLHALGMAQPVLGGLQRRLRAALHPAVRGFSQLALDRRTETPEVVLQDVIVRTGTHRVDR